MFIIPNIAPVKQQECIYLWTNYVMHTLIHRLPGPRGIWITRVSTGPILYFLKVKIIEGFSFSWSGCHVIYFIWHEWQMVYQCHIMALLHLLPGLHLSGFYSACRILVGIRFLRYNYGLYSFIIVLKIVFAFFGSSLIIVLYFSPHPINCP